MELVLEGEFLLEKFSGKGGWTFCRIPVTHLPFSKSFGMVKVSGSIDDFGFESKHLMPMGNGCLFLPISKSIRKALQKEEGDRVVLKLFRDQIPSSIPEELIACLEDDPGKLILFQKLSEAVQKQWIEFIYTGNSEEIEHDSKRHTEV